MKTISAACCLLLQALYFSLGLWAVVGSVCLLVVASSAQGQRAGILVLCLVGASVAIWPARRPRLASALFLSALGLLLWSLNASPLQNPDTRFVAVYEHSSRPYRLSPSSLVPEVDQLLLGSKAASVVDPLLSFARGQRLSALTQQVYDELDKDPDFALAPTALGTCYQEILGFGATRGPLLTYRPKQQSKKRLPVLLFLHGSLGNFRAYSWTLKALADRRELALVAPSFGAGNWYKPGGIETLNAALDYIRQQPDLDSSKVMLIALSNGGIGAGMLAHQSAASLQGMVLLSAVLWPQHFEPHKFASSWGQRPLLLLHGEDDERVSFQRTKEYSSAFQAQGLAVSTAWFAGEDHFLFFSKRKQLLDEIERWACRHSLWEGAKGER